MPHTQSYELPYPAISTRPLDKSSFVYWSLTPPTKAIVFVHGFSGNPQSTWKLGFFRELRASAQCSEYDIYSLGYDWTIEASSNASELLEITKALFESPGRVFDDSIRRTQYQGQQPAARGPFAYEKVTFVCHSLGALLCRRIISEAHAKGEAWADRIDSVLFAPAHTGGRPLRLASVASKVSSAIAKVVMYRWPILEDLEPGSAFIEQTIQNTTALLQGHAARPTSLICTKIAHAGRDRIVGKVPFCLDPLPFERMQHHDHVSICKVYTASDDAIVYLLSKLQ